MIIPLGLVGSLLHFAFDWFNHNRFIALFAAVNASYWEHIKIAVWPVFSMHLAFYFFGGFSFPSFIPASTVSLYSIPISMIGLVFLYKFFAKRNILWIDIGTFFLVIAISQLLFVNLLFELKPTPATNAVSILFLIGLICSFAIFTIRPPKEPDFFVDPTNRRYGLGAHDGLDEKN